MLAGAMADSGGEDNQYYRAFLNNFGQISNDIWGAGGSNMTNLASYLMSNGLIQPADHLAAISGGDPTAIANRLCTVTMNTLKGSPHLYKSLLDAFTASGYKRPRDRLLKDILAEEELLINKVHPSDTISAASQANQAVCTVFHDYRDQLVLAIRNPFRLLAPLCSSEVISPADRDELLNCTDADDFNMSIKLINAVEVTMRAAPRALLVMQKFYQVITHTTAAVDLNMVKSIMPKMFHELQGYSKGGDGGFGDNGISLALPGTEIASHSINVQSVVNAYKDARGLVVIVTNANYQKSTTYSILGFTEKDGRAMEQTLKEFDFNCYLVKDVTGDEIRDVVDQISKCNFPDSYKYVVFVYSGHGDVESKRSGLVGIDGKLVETTSEVINPLKAIQPQSMVKILFLDACRGNKLPPPVTKGGSTNCLVAYATQLGQVSFASTANGSKWMIPLADKLKQRDKSVQEVLKMVKEELLKLAWPQYPETDDSDYALPIYLDKEPVESKGAPAVPRVGEIPNIGDLASFARRDRDGLIQIIDQILEEDMSVIQSLNRLLLSAKDRLAQPEAGDEHKLRFVLEVLTKWLSTEKPKTDPTWENLTECLEDAGLNKDAVKDIRNNL